MVVAIFFFFLNSGTLEPLIAKGDTRVLLDPWFSIGDGFTHLGELMLSVDIFDCHNWVWEILLASGW